MMVTGLLSQRPINGNPIVYPSPLSRRSSSSLLKWELLRDKDGSLVASRTKSHAFRILANTSVSGKRDPKNEIVMVDPLEAKRLAAKQMQEIKAKQKLKRQRQIEAINGAWAMIGLTAGLVIEGQTGRSILNQLAGYWSAFVHLFVQ